MARSGHILKIVLLLTVVALLTGCAAGRAFRRGESAARAGNWDAAVDYYRRAVQAAPNSAEYRIALERASINASHAHIDRAKEFEAKGQLDAALREYRRAVEFDPTNRQAAQRVQEIERTIQERIEAARPRPPIEKLREQARAASQEPVLNPASREPLYIKFTNAQLRDILNFIANASGINITFDREFQDRPYSVELNGVSLEQALQQILTANQLFYKVLNERTIIVIPDTPQKRAAYEEQVIRTFFVSHADVTELAQLLNTVVRLPQMAVQPMFAPNKNANTLTVRASTSTMGIVERVIEANDRPRAEIVVDVEILEVNRNRAKQFGLDLSQFQLGLIFSPETNPFGGTTTGGTTTPSTTASTSSNPSFNLNTISKGIATNDFYATVPTAVVRFLETDSETKLVAKPQLRGSEGEKLTLNLGDEIPVPSTTFTPIVGGGANFNPLTSFAYKPVGVNVEIEPRVTFEGDIVMKLSVESSTRGQDVNIAGQNLPSFGSRKVTTRLRLRDGESNLLAGLLREDDRKSLRGFPGAIHVPILQQLFSANDNSISQTDIVMLLTPRIIRTHELTQRDLSPIFIGTQQNPGLSGPPPLIAPPGGAAPGAPPTGVTPPLGVEPGAPAGVPTGPPTSAPTGVPGTAPSQPTVPAGSLIPGTITPPAAVPVPPPGAPPGVPAPTPEPGAAPAAPPTGVTPPPTTTPPEAPPPAAPTAPPAAATPQPPALPQAAQVIVTPPGSQFAVGGGPYTVPVSITGASRVSTVSLSLTFNPAVLRVRAVQEGSFLRQGGTAVAFTQQVSPSGRVDITLVRTGDTVGAAGSGLLAAIVFDAAAAGTSPLTLSGVATAPDGSPVTAQFASAAITVR